MSLRILVLAGMAMIAAACASAGGKSAQRKECELSDRDSVFAVGGPVYRDCAVDRAARLLATNRHPDFRPSGVPHTTCYSADLEFVVDSTGKPETRMARIVRTNDQGYAESVLVTLTSWTYDPALRDHRPVRQIVTSHQTMATMVVVVPAGAPLPSGPPTQRPSSC